MRRQAPGCSWQAEPNKLFGAIYWTSYQGKATAGQQFSSAIGDEVKVGAPGSDGKSNSCVDTVVHFGTVSGYSDQAVTAIGSPRAYVDQSGLIDLDPLKNR